MFTKTAQRTITGIVAGLGLLATAAASDAAIINMNHNRNAATSISGAYGTGTGELLAPVAYTGTTWNNNRGSGNNLRDSDNNVTTVDFSLTGQTGFNGGQTGFATEPNMEALNNYAFSNATDTTPMLLTLTDLTIGQAYDLHVMAASSVGQGATVTMVSGAAVLPATSVSASTTNWLDATSFVLGDNFTTQSWVADSTTAVFRLDDNLNPDQTFAAFNGFQLEVIPEPASLGLLGLGGLLLLGRRRG